jgi:hypothetical protein
MDPAGPTFVQYLFMAFMALCGSIGRAGLWRDPQTGKWLWWKFTTEICTAILIGVMSGSLAMYKHIDMPIAFGISGLLGLLGPAAIIGFVTAKLGVKANADGK